MWQCQKCNRFFKHQNQSHMCSTKTIDDLLANKPEGMVLAFDHLLLAAIDWEPCTVGASTKSIIFTKEKAWLIVKPMKKELDLKFYYPSEIQHLLIHKRALYGNKYAHHIRISHESQVTEDLIALLRKAWESS